MSKKLIFIFTLALCLLVFSETKAQSLLKNDEIPEDLIITLSRTFFWKELPDYKLVINSDGTVNFENGYSAETKKAAGKISQDEIRKLLAEFEKAGFFNLRDTYYQEKDGCTEIWEDNPWEAISIRINGKSKSVFHYLGCRKVLGNPTENIKALGLKIDEITNSKRWITEQK